MTTGQRIGELAQKKKINLHQLSKMAGISYNTLYSIVRRKSDKVDYETVSKIAAALGVSQVELSTGMSEQAWRNQMEEELKEFEAENRERLLAVFAMKHPRFMESLNSVGISIRLEEKEMYAEWEDVSVELTMEDIEELHDKMQRDFFNNIQRLWSIPIADEYLRSEPSEGLEDDEGDTDL